MGWKLLISCFFFQAEDGIRDRNVTGVQTCALPISTNGFAPRRLVAVIVTRYPCCASTPASPSGAGPGSRNDGKIGRASCRERVEMAEVGGGVLKKWLRRGLTLEIHEQNVVVKHHRD